MAFYAAGQRGAREAVELAAREVAGNGVRRRDQGEFQAGDVSDRAGVLAIDDEGRVSSSTYAQGRRLALRQLAIDCDRTNPGGKPPTR
jgi:hypothetical protein